MMMLLIAYFLFTFVCLILIYMEHWVARTKDGRFLRCDKKPFFDENLGIWRVPKDGLSYGLDHEEEYPYPPITFEESPKQIIFSHYPYFHFVGYSEE